MLLRRRFVRPRWQSESPFEDIERMRRQMDLLTGSLLGGVSQEPSAGVFPLMNVTEDGDNYYVRAELPGIKADDFDITVTGDSLSLSGERKIPAEKETVKYHRKEREAGRFSRVVSLPGQINTDKVEAACTLGVLTITLPKEEATKPKQITVKGT